MNNCQTADSGGGDADHSLTSTLAQHRLWTQQRLLAGPPSDLANWGVMVIRKEEEACNQWKVGATVVTGGLAGEAYGRVSGGV